MKHTALFAYPFKLLILIVIFCQLPHLKLKAQCSNAFTYDIIDTTCSIGTYKFNAFASATIDTAIWNFDDGIFSSEINPAHVFDNLPHTYNVTLTTVDINNCTSETTIPVSVDFINPMSIGYAFDYNTNCACVDVTGGPGGGTPPYNIEWYDIDNLFLQTSGVFPICEQDSTPYIIRVIDNYGCLLEDTVTVNTHHSTYDTTYLCETFAVLEAPDGADYYHWSDGFAGQITTVFGVGDYYVNCVFPDCPDTVNYYHAVNPCDTCFNTIDYTAETSSSCVVTIQLSGTSPTPIEGWYWDFGDNNSSNSPNPTYIYNVPGVYTVSLTTTDTNNCTATNTFDLEVYGEYSIQIETDTTLGCQECVQLSAQGFPSPIVAYEWSGLNFGPENIFNLDICHADNELVTLTGIDANGCVATDTIAISAYNTIDDTVYMCQGLDTIVLDAGPGADYYLWSDGTENQTADILTVGTYVCYAVFPQCDTLISTIVVEDDCIDPVWPGDANSDGLANNLDLLSIGTGFQASGPVRPMASVSWVPQGGDNWVDSLNSGVNYKHVDCNGDGVINSDDTLAIALNYGFTHNKNPNPNYATVSDPLLYVEFSPDTPGVNELVTINVYLGTENQLANDVYGMAFSLNLIPGLIDTNSVQVSFANSWMGTINQDLLGLSHFDSGSGKLDMALTRTDHINISGYGPIATVNVITIDNLSGKQETLYEELAISFSDILLINNEEIEIPVNSENASITISDDINGIGEVGNPAHISIYPNPARDEVFVRSSRQIQQVLLRDALGRAVITDDFSGDNIRIDIGSLPKGIYTIEVITDNNTHQQSLIVLDK